MGSIEVSVIIPCRNEEKFIGECLNSIVNQTYPKGGLEVFVLDGMSIDGTRAAVEEYTSQYPYIKRYENQGKSIPSAMNIGIKNSSGKIIMKVDAHTVYERDYIEKCVKYLKSSGADNVGGITIAVPRENTIVGRAIVESLSSPFGVGGAKHRLNPKGPPIWADTAYSGCYRRDVFDRVGLYDENVSRSEDVALNSRIRKSGGRILLVPEIRTYYQARSTFFEFCRHNLDNGFWITYPLKFRRVVFSVRHLVPLIFVMVLFGSLLLSFAHPAFLQLFTVVCGSYLVTNLFFSAKIAFIKKRPEYLVMMPIIFASLHIFNGLGCVYGLVKTILPKE